MNTLSYPSITGSQYKAVLAALAGHDQRETQNEIERVSARGDVSLLCWTDKAGACVRVGFEYTPLPSSLALAVRHALLNGTD
jgi:hypothetical protein